jgi:uncharacterized protein
VAIAFDPAKDAANIEKHGISLSRSVDIEAMVIVTDNRFHEPRYRGYGLIDGTSYCLAFTVRGSDIRAISLRRAHAKEFRRHVP